MATKKNSVTELTNKTFNAGFKGIVSATSTIGQVCRQFVGLYGDVLDETEGCTVEYWLSLNGMVRPTTTDKKGRVCKKDYNLKSVGDAWHPSMKKEGKMCIYRSLTAKWTDGKIVHKVYTLEEAKKADGKPISRYQLTEIPVDGWSVKLILRGLRQKRDFDKNHKRATTSKESFEGIKNFYIVTVKEGANGEEERVLTEVSANEVYFDGEVKAQSAQGDSVSNSLDLRSTFKAMADFAFEEGKISKWFYDFFCKTVERYDMTDFILNESGKILDDCTMGICSGNEALERILDLYVSTYQK